MAVPAPNVNKIGYFSTSSNHTNDSIGSFQSKRASKINCSAWTAERASIPAVYILDPIPISLSSAQDECFESPKGPIRKTGASSNEIVAQS